MKVSPAFSPLSQRTRRHALGFEALEARRPLASVTGMTAHWAGEGNANDSTGSYHGVMQPGTSYAPGLVDQAFQFSGDGEGAGGYVEVADSPAWALGTRDFTIQAWVNLASVLSTGGGHVNAIVTQGEGPGPNRKWSFHFAGHMQADGLAHGSLEMHLNDPSFSGGLWFGRSYTLAPGTWHHLAVTRSGSTFTFYADGLSLGTRTYAGSIPDVAAPLKIGAFESGSSFNGLLDELQILDRAAEPFELRASYLAIAQATVTSNDQYATPRDNTLYIPAPGVLGNDPLALSAALVSSPQNGTLTLRPDGSFVYSPSAGFTGQDSFTYRVSDASAGVATAVIDVTVPIPAALPAGAIAWWKGEGNAEDAIGSHHGVVREGAGFEAGKVEKAISFAADGSGAGGFVEVPDSPDWTLGHSDFSIAAWVNVRSALSTGGGHINAIASQGEGPGPNRKWSFHYAGHQQTDGIVNGSLEIHFNDPSFRGGEWLGQPFSMASGTWHHFAMTRSGSTFGFFADGILLGTNTFTGSIPDVAAALKIGAFESGSSLNGLIDELIIFNRAITPAEIQAIYQAASAGLVIRVNAEDGAQNIPEVAQLVFPQVPPGGSPELSFQTGNSNPALFTTQPAIDSTGKLTFTPAPNSKGTAIVSVLLTNTGPGGEGEGGGELDNSTGTFTIEVLQLYPEQNDDDWWDVDDDDGLDPSDIILIIDFLNGIIFNGTILDGSVPLDKHPVAPYRDTSGNNSISPLDAVLLINILNAPAAQPPATLPEGESGSLAAAAAPPRAGLTFDTAQPAPFDDLVTLLANDLAEQTKRRRK